MSKQEHSKSLEMRVSSRGRSVVWTGILVLMIAAGALFWMGMEKATSFDRNLKSEFSISRNGISSGSLLPLLSENSDSDRESRERGEKGSSAKDGEEASDSEGENSDSSSGPGGTTVDPGEEQQEDTPPWAVDQKKSDINPEKALQESYHRNLSSPSGTITDQSFTVEGTDLFPDQDIQAYSNEQVVILPAQVSRRHVWLELLLSGPEGKTHETFLQTDTGARKINLAMILAGFENNIRPLSIAHTGTAGKLITGNGDHTIRFWNMKKSSQPETFYGHPGNPISLVYLNEHDIIVSGSDNGNIYVYHRTEDETGPTLLLNDDSPVISMQKGPDSGDVWAVHRGGTVTELQLDKKEDQTRWSSTTRVRIEENITDAHVVPKTETIAYADNSGQIGLIQGDGSVSILQNTDHEMTSIGVTPDGQVLIAGTAGGTLLVIDTETGNVTGRENAYRGEVTNMSIPKNNRVITGTRNGNLDVWTLPSLDNIRSFRGQKGPVMDMALSGSGNSFYVPGGDSVIRQWQLEGETGQPTGALRVEGPRYFGDPSLPMGDPVFIQVEWQLQNGNWVRFRIEDLLRNMREGRTMRRMGFVYTGSEFRQQTTAGGQSQDIFAAERVETYVANYHDPSSIIDLPALQGGADTVYQPRSRALPPSTTDVRLILSKPSLQDLRKMGRAIHDSLSTWDVQSQTGNGSDAD